MKVVGARIPRYDGVAHVTGRTTYVDDVSVPGTLWAKALRSPHHHAGITSLDTSKAEAMPGVHAVITWKDVPLLEYGHLAALGIHAARETVRWPLVDRGGRYDFSSLEPFARAAVIQAAANHPDDELLREACARML